MSPANRALETDRATLERIEWLAYLLDDRFRIPGTPWRIGLDGLLGLIPGIGDLAGTAIAAYVVAEAQRLGLPRRTLARMLGNLGIDFLLGLIPGLGDVLDVAWKANRRNVRLLHQHLASRNPGLRQDLRLR